MYVLCRYSQDLLRIIAALLTATEGGPLNNVRQLAAHPAILDRTWQQMDATSSQVDNLVSWDLSCTQAPCSHVLHVVLVVKS